MGKTNGFEDRTPVQAMRGSKTSCSWCLDVYRIWGWITQDSKTNAFDMGIPMLTVPQP
jgi:hypothetical protein